MKGGKIVVMDTEKYVKNSELIQTIKKLYEKLDAISMLNYIKVKQKNDNVLKK